ncbi:MAG: LysM peptidoglycan-binding domain-containing protein, partial [Acidobacteriota bacterium]
IWQFMSYTGNDYGLRQNFWIDERSDVEKSTRAAARYLKALHEMFGDWYLALGAYNWGPGRIERLLNRHGALSFWEMMDKDFLPQETFNYVPSILATIIIAKNPEKYGFQVQYEAPLAFDKVPMRGQLDLRVASELIGTEVQHLLELNPELVRGITPKDLDFSLRVPQGLGEELQEQLAQLPSSRWVRNESYQIRPGDTLASIARRRGISKFSLASANDLTVRSRLKIGSELLIPAHLWMKPAFEAQTTLATRTRTHRVRRGETLGAVARRYKVSVAALRSWNRLGARSVLRVDQGLVIRRPASAPELRSAKARTKGTKVASRGAPAASKSHQVRKGESLASIARRYKVGVTQLRRWNGLASGTIRAGSRLVILTPLSK